MAVFNKDKKSFALLENDIHTNTENKPQNVEGFVISAKGSQKNLRNLSGRPIIDDEKKKNKYIMIYVTEEQKKVLKEKAQNSNLSVSKYISIKLFGIE